MDQSREVYIESEPDPSKGLGVGTVVRRLRRERGMSLQELAVASGVSVGMLSQVERDLTNPSVRVLTGIRTAFGLPLSALFEETPRIATDPAFARRVGNRPMLELGHLRKELLSAGSSHNLQVMILHLDADGSSGSTPLSYPAEKAGMVLAGQVVLWVGDDKAELNEGDSFVFDSSAPHGFRASGGAPAKVLWIIGAVQLDRHL